MSLCQLLGCVQLCMTPWTAACRDPLSLDFSRQAYNSGLPFPSPGDLPNPGIKPWFPCRTAGRFFTIWAVFTRCIFTAVPTNQIWTGFSPWLPPSTVTLDGPLTPGTRHPSLQLLCSGVRCVHTQRWAQARHGQTQLLCPLLSRLSSKAMNVCYQFWRKTQTPLIQFGFS